MNKVKVIIALVTSSLVTFAIAATTLSPNQNNQSGIIPGGYDDLIFSVSNGNWVKTISLPDTAKEDALLTLSSRAGYDSEFDLSNIRINKTGYLPLKAGNTYQFKFHNGKWEFYVSESNSLNPKKTGSTIPAFEESFTKYTIDDTAWTDIVHLPQTAKDGQLIVIESKASAATKIDSQYTLFPSTLTLHKNDLYIFQYNLELNKWVPFSTPTRIFNVQGDTATFNQKLQNLTAPKTEIRFADGAWIPSLKLPQSANDRDRLIITSSATWQSTIENENTDTTATMKLNSGDRYEFIYIADKAQWILISSPKTVLTAKKAAQGFTFKTPIVEIIADNTEWVSTINLPNIAQSGDKVILSNSADTAFKITGNNIAATLNKGDKIRFVFKNNVWNIDSHQIDLLIVNSPVVNEKLGATAAKIRAREALRLTNEALENSQARAYFREVGYFGLSHSRYNFR
ncbi:metalloendopeptidase CpaA [Acinetobacter sp. WZC-1]|uniref:metalloendopeptidase CpaA n=1 Tax=Acinetobacter sp. WZC-1 TaxID=3459034 RepID=UPI00403D76A7